MSGPAKCSTWSSSVEQNPKNCKLRSTQPLLIVKIFGKKLGAIIGGENVCFDPFSIISHATDATDWRLHLPVAIVRPANEDQIAPLLEAISELGLKVIPRGGGTGLTGGAVPVSSGCVIINTEKTQHDPGNRTPSFRR